MRARVALQADLERGTFTQHRELRFALQPGAEAAGLLLWNAVLFAGSRELDARRTDTHWGAVFVPVRSRFRRRQLLQCASLHTRFEPCSFLAQGKARFPARSRRRSSWCAPRGARARCASRSRGRTPESARASGGSGACAAPSPGSCPERRGRPKRRASGRRKDLQPSKRDSIVRGKPVGLFIYFPFSSIEKMLFFVFEN